MKKLYSIFVLAVLALAGLTANAIDIKFVLTGEGELLVGTDTPDGFNFSQKVGQGETTLDLESGGTQYYFKAAEGYEVVRMHIAGNSSDMNPIREDLAHGLSGVYNQAIRRVQTFEVELKKAEGGEGPVEPDPDPIVNPDEVKVTFIVNDNGGADLYEYNTSTQLYDFVQALPVGESTELTLSKKTFYNVVAAEGMELQSVVNAAGAALKLNTNKNYDGRTYVSIDGATASTSYTITATPKAVTIPVVFNLTQGSVASVYMDDFFAEELTLVKALEEGANTVDLTPGAKYAIVAGEGLVFKSILDADGKSIETFPFDEYYNGAFALVQGANASASYTITTEKDQTDPVTDGVKFTLTEGSKAVLYTANNDELVPAQELAEGESVLNLDFNANLYYILPAEGYRLVSVVTAEGTEVELLEDPDYFATNAAFINENQSTAYTITTEPLAGIETIEAADAAAAQWFDIQGRCVERPAAGLYIRLMGGVASKVLVK